MTDVVARATEAVKLLERSDAPAVSALLSERVRGWSVDAYLRDEWRPGLDDLAGSPRRIVEARRVSDSTVRCVLEGERGQGFVTIRFDDDDRLDGLSLDGRIFEGIGTIVIACPRERREELAAFYANLLGSDRRRAPRLAFGESRSGYRPPLWPDPDAPQQLHLDFLVRDSEAAERMVLGSGATLLQDTGTYRSYADPVGHPFCLYPDESRGVFRDGSLAVLARVVIDCFSPRALAAFYEALLVMSTRVEDAPERVVIAKRTAACRCSRSST